MRGHIHGKTGSLSTVIALSGVLDLDPTRPLAFSIVTNTLRPLKKGYVRKAHEQLVALLAKYIDVDGEADLATVHVAGDARHARRSIAPALTDSTPAEETAAEAAEAQPDPELDVETATSK